MAEFCIVDDRHQFAIPDSLSEDSAAAMAIPGMSSWAALVERANLRTGETVLINGATGTSGRLAIQIAKHLGAKKVIATGRQTRLFDDLRLLGADVTVPLIQDRDALENAFKNEFQQGVDIVLDYLWGMSAETLVIAAAKAGPEGVPIRYVQIWLDQRDEHQPAKRRASVVCVAAHGQRDRKHPVPRKPLNASINQFRRLLHPQASR